MNIHFVEHAHAEQVVYHHNKAVGVVVGVEFQKRLQGSKHFLQKPPAIANDESVLISAQKLGATEVAIFDTETGTVFRASISDIWGKGFTLDRGWGKQIGLPMNKWHATLPPQNTDIDKLAGS